MASYHFRIKSDKKSNGEKVSASVHVDYISRQGKYKNEGGEKNIETNTITFANKKIFHDETFPLYLTDDFGKIICTPKGLQVNGKYSAITLSIALTLAKNFSDDQEIILQGSKKFKDKILAVASQNNFDVNFANENLQKKIVRMKEKKFSAEENLSDDLKSLAKKSADEILQNLEELRTQVSAAKHFEYINREKKYARRGDCIFTSHQLPKWAKENPKNFFAAADKYEGKNRRRYVEIEMSLPNELTDVNDFKKIIDKFLEHHLKNHYYTYAVHDKIGNFSGERHPHVHIMFSERLIDDVEKNLSAVKRRSMADMVWLFTAAQGVWGSMPQRGLID